MNCFNHKDKPAVADCRFCGKNVCKDCAVELGTGRGIACSVQCEKEGRAFLRKADRRQRLAEIAFIAVSVAVTWILAWVMKTHGGPWKLFLLPFAVGAVMMTWFVFFTSWQLYVRVMRGAPFRSGDAVVITEGPHKGLEGKVVRKSAGSRTTVIVGITVEGEPIVHHFGWVELRKIRGLPASRRQ